MISIQTTKDFIVLQTERACLAAPTAAERRAKKRRGFDGPQ
jgi:hypothetical protein